MLPPPRRPLPFLVAQTFECGARQSQTMHSRIVSLGTRWFVISRIRACVYMHVGVPLSGNIGVTPAPGSLLQDLAVGTNQVALFVAVAAGGHPVFEQRPTCGQGAGDFRPRRWYVVCAKFSQCCASTHLSTMSARYQQLTCLAEHPRARLRT